MNRKLVCELGVGLSLITCTLGGIFVGQTESTPSKPPLSEEVYKNIQILKGIPADEVIPAMQFITYSLGVECSFCHVEGALEKDDKKAKQTARKMMQMMAAINQTNFDSKREVTCYSCHRGSAHPLAIPVVAETGPSAMAATMGDQQASAAPSFPSVEQILAKYVDAVGGASALAKLSTREERGTLSVAGRQLPIAILSKTPAKQVSIIHLPNGDNITAYNGISGWTSGPHGPVRDLSRMEAASARVEADLQLPIHLKQLFGEIKTEKPENIGGREVYVISGLNAGELAAKFYFDEQSGLLLRILRYVNSPLGQNPTQIDYADYRDQDGVKMPFQETIARPDTRLAIHIDEARYNVPVDDARFARPADPPPERPNSP
jgi:photosynthetic reaction center cytochrome c subunit